MGADRGTQRRQRIVEAASRLIYELGVGATTLADVADEAGVPVGGLYYYFRTKSDLVAAALERHCRLQDAMFADIEGTTEEPIGRIRAYLERNADESKWASGRGCEHGLLSIDLLRSREELVTRAHELLAIHLRWIGAQARSAGAAEAGTVAAHLVAQIQGAYLLAAVTRQPHLVKTQIDHLNGQLERIIRPEVVRAGHVQVSGTQATDD